MSPELVQRGSSNSTTPHRSQASNVPTVTPNPTLNNSLPPPPNNNDHHDNDDDNRNFDHNNFDVDNDNNDGQMGGNEDDNFDVDNDNDAAYQLALANSISEIPPHAGDKILIKRSVINFLGMNLLEIPPDGSCLFRCFFHFYEERGGGFIDDHVDMRKCIVFHISENWDDYASFFLSTQEKEGEQTEADDPQEARECCRNKEEYIEAMKKGKAWGGQAEMAAFEDLTGLKIHIVEVTMKGLSLSNLLGAVLGEFDISKPDRLSNIPKGVHDVFLNHAGGAHYDVVCADVDVTDAAAVGVEDDKEDSEEEEEREKEEREKEERAAAQAAASVARVAVVKNKKKKGKKKKGKEKKKVVPPSVGAPSESSDESEKEQEQEEKEEEEEEEEREKEEREKEERERGKNCIFSVDLMKKDRLSEADFATLIEELEKNPCNIELRAAISTLLKKLKNAQHQSIGASSVEEEEEEEEDEVVDFSDSSNENRLMFIIEKDGTKRVALLVSAMSKTGKLKEKLATDWAGPMQEEWMRKLINVGIANWPSQEQAKEAIWRAGGARDPGKPLLLDLDMDIVDYHKDDNWKLVKTQFDLDFVDATVPGRIAADILCSELGNSFVSFQHRIDGVDPEHLRATVGGNVVVCLTPRDAARFQEFCSNEGGRLLPNCTNTGKPVRFFNSTRKSVPDGVLRAFLCQEGVYARVVGYGMNMKLDVRGLAVLKQLRNGVKECESFKIPPAWTTTEVSDFKTGLCRPPLIDFSGVIPMDRVVKDGKKETRVVVQEKVEETAIDNQLIANIYPIGLGDGKTKGTVTYRKVRSR